MSDQSAALARVSVSARKIADARAYLERDVRAAREAGCSIRSIAAAAGMNHETMRKLLQKEAPE